jgi:Domain of unknown function (DUF4390)
MVGMRIIKKIFVDGVCIPLFVVFAFLCFPAQGRAVQPRIADILISNNSENLFLYARCVDCFKTEMESAILAGVPTVFTLQLDVCQERLLIWNKTIISKEIKRTIKYDNLKKTFSIYTNDNLDAVVFPDFESAQKAMADFNGIIASPLSALDKGNQYYLKMRVKIDKVRLPLYMEYVFFFVSFWDFETAWYKKGFFY